MKRYTVEDFPYFSDLPDEENEAFLAGDSAPIYDEPSQPRTNVSRRGFLAFAASVVAGLAADTVTSFGWRGAVVTAYADEAGDKTFTISVFKRWETPLICYDVTKNPAQALPGTVFTFHSLDTGKEATVTAADTGYAILDLRANGLVTQEVAEQNEFRANGSLTADCAGYRMYDVQRVVVQGGQETDTATEPEDGSPYLSSVTFDGFDIQYEKDTFVCRSVHNDTDHTLRVRVMGDAKTATVTIDQGEKSGFKLGPTKVSPVSGSGARTLFDVTFTDKYLYSGGAYQGPLLTGDEPIYVRVTTDEGTQNERSFAVQTTLAVQEAIFEPVEPGTKMNDAPFDHINFRAPGEQGNALVGAGESSLSFTLPSDKWPKFLAGKTVTIAFPVLPVRVYLDESGLIMAVGEFCISRKDDFNKAKYKIGWPKQWMDDAMKCVKEAGKAKKDRSSFATTKFAKSYEITFEILLGYYEKKVSRNDPAYAKLMANYPDVVSFLSGGIVFRTSLAVGFQLFWSFFLLWVPFYVQWDIGATGFFELQGQLYSAQVEKNSTKLQNLGPVVEDANANGTGPDTPKTSYRSAGVDVSTSLTAGLGYAGFASFYVRGYGSISFHWTWADENPLVAPGSKERKSNPHFVILAAAGLAAGVQLFVCKASVELLKGKWVLKDNWGRNLEAPYLDWSMPQDIDLGTNLLYTEGVTTQDELLAALVPVSQEELGGRSEISEAGNAVDGENAAWVRTGNGATYEPCLSAGNSISGLDDGPRLTETLVYKDVFSDPKAKLFTMDGVAYLARIVPVTYANGAVRTRLSIASRVDGVWGEPVVVGAENGPWAGLRADLFDYDFELAALRRTSDVDLKWMGAITVTLISGLRPADGDATLAEVASDMVLTVLYIDTSLQASVMHSQRFASDESKGECYTISNPFAVLNVTPQGETIEAAGISWVLTVAGAFVRKAATKDALFSGPFEETPYIWADDSVREHCSTWMLDPYKNPPTNLVEVRDALETCNKTNVSMLVQFAVSQKSGNYIPRFVLSYVNVTGEGEQTQREGKYAICTGCDHGQLYIAKNASEGFSWLHLFTQVGSLGAYSCLRPWCPDVDTYLTLDDSRSRYLIATGGTSQDPAYDVVSVEVAYMPEHLMEERPKFDIKIDHLALLGKPRMAQEVFVSPDTGALYYADIYEGPGAPVVGEDGTLTPGKEVRRYTVQSMSIVQSDGGYALSNPFTLAVLDHPIDQLMCAGTSSEYEFLYGTTTSLAQSRADFYHCAVPKFMHVSCTDFGSDEAWVCAGESERFVVTVSNDGNVAVQQFALDIALEDGSFTQSVVLDLTSDEVEKVAEKNDSARAAHEAAAANGIDAYGDSNVMQTPPAVSDIAKAGVLLPGETRTYIFSWTVPEDWDNDVNLHVSVQPGSVRLASMPEYSQSLHAGALQAAAVGVTEVKVAKAALDIKAESLSSMSEDVNVQRSVYTQEGSDPEGPGGGNGGNDGGDGGNDDGDGGAGGGSRSGSGSLAKTGDASPVVPMVLGLGGAALMAYSARRTRLEREKDEL